MKGNPKNKSKITGKVIDEALPKNEDELRLWLKHNGKTVCQICKKIITKTCPNKLYCDKCKKTIKDKEWNHKKYLNIKNYKPEQYKRLIERSLNFDKEHPEYLKQRGRKWREEHIIKSKSKLKRLIDYHFKCDCLACIQHGNNPEKCIEQSKCEVAQTYFKIIKEINV